MLHHVSNGASLPEFQGNLSPSYDFPGRGKKSDLYLHPENPFILWHKRPGWHTLTRWEKAVNYALLKFLLTHPFTLC